MKTTYHSEYLKLNTVFIKPANNAFVSEHILKEQWRAHNFLDQPDYKKTLTEYDFFRKALQKMEPLFMIFPLMKMSPLTLFIAEMHLLQQILE